MSEVGVAPRINRSMMNEHMGHAVTVVGRVMSSSPQQAVIETSDGGVVNVVPSPGSDYSSTYVEIIGKVLQDGSLQEYKCTHFGDKFDMRNYEQLVQLTHGKYRDLFL